MPYFETNILLKEIFKPESDEIKIADSKLVIRNVEFNSTMDFPPVFSDYYEENISENIRFRYPIIMHEGRKANQAIIYLHGLNERSWQKHLAGAMYLAEKSGKAVILFPLSFHINRGLPEWTDVHKMSERLSKRIKEFSNITDASIANLALSERLTQHPQRFFVSGMQSTNDLIDLINSIQTGRHPLFDKNTGIDIFAYSISCMLLQSLLISDKAVILRNSRIVLFAGGSIFENIRGISRYIMDSVAFERIKNYYMELTIRRKRFSDQVQSWISENNYGHSFLAMLKTNMMKKIREQAMNNFQDNLMILALRDDKVMPIEGIKLAAGDRFTQNCNFKEFHFPYPYTHENPFPVLNRKIDQQVEQAFTSVYNTVLKFFAR
jgi:hypothetical protein